MVIVMSYNYIFYCITLIIGIVIIIVSFKDYFKLKKGIKTKAIVLGFHSDMGSDTYVTRVEFNVNGKPRECDLNFYSVLLRKGKKITIYYNPNYPSEIYCSYSIIFTSLLGIIFIAGSIYLFLIT